MNPAINLIGGWAAFVVGGLAGATDGADYRLKPTSPLINAGANLGYTVDLAGNPIVGAPDIGPYEFQPSATPNGIPLPTSIW